jgi:hypothetical protein
MGEHSPALPSSGPQEASISHRRLLIEMAALIVMGMVIGFLVGGPRFGLGVVFGGGLSLLNYFWLKRSTTAIFENALTGTAGFLVPLRFISRYFALGLVLLGVYFSDVVPVVAVIAGLAAFAVAVVVDGLISIFRRNS